MAWCVATLLHVFMYLSIEKHHSMTQGLGARQRRGENSLRGSHLLLHCDRKWRLCRTERCIKNPLPISDLLCRSQPSRVEARQGTTPHHTTPRRRTPHRHRPQRAAICDAQLWGAGCFIKKGGKKRVRERKSAKGGKKERKNRNKMAARCGGFAF